MTSHQRPDKCQHPTTRSACSKDSSCIHRGVHRCLKDADGEHFIVRKLEKGHRGTGCKRHEEEETSYVKNEIGKFSRFATGTLNGRREDLPESCAVVDKVCRAKVSVGDRESRMIHLACASER